MVPHFPNVPHFLRIDSSCSDVGRPLDISWTSSTTQKQSLLRRPNSTGHAAALLLAAGAEGQRFALPNARIMLHQPSGGFQGQATDIEIHAKEILSLRQRLNEIYVVHTGQEIAVIEDNLERDKFMTPQEAKTFGIVDDVVARRPEDGEDADGKNAAKKGG